MTAITPPIVPGSLNRRAVGQFSRPVSESALKKDSNEKIPKMVSAQEPSDIGDQYFNIGLNVFDSSSMCQKRSGRYKSTVKSMPLMITHGKEIKYPKRASGRSCGLPKKSIRTARK